MAQQKDNSGVIFQNDRKTKDTDPDGKGSAVIDGVEYLVASWVNYSEEKDIHYKSLRFTRKDEQGGGGQQGQGQGQRRQPARQSAPAGPRPTKQQATADGQRYQQQRAIPPQDARQAAAAPTAGPAPTRHAPARQDPPPPIQEQEPAGPMGEETHFASEDIPF